MTIPAARPLRRHLEPLREVALLCHRCDRPFFTLTLAWHCHPCAKAARKTYGTAHPSYEMSGN